ncbi:MAG: response regulator [Deltaproteobacteria bacterium]|nr:MAG: response regulator [Deltaproteobacteria bacterium]
MGETRPGLLVLEGDARFRADLAESLNALGYPVAVASKTEQAIEILRDRAVGLVVADASLATPGGAGVVQQLRTAAQNPQLPVFLSAPQEPSSEEVGAAVASGVLGILQRNAPIAEAVYRLNAQLTGRLPARFTGAPRVKVRTPVHFLRLGDGGELSRAGVAEDLSRTGLFLSTAATAAVGTDLKLRFALPREAGQIDCEGRVARVVFPGRDSAGGGLGIAFHSLRSTDRRALACFVIDRLLRASPIFHA